MIGAKRRKSPTGTGQAGTCSAKACGARIVWVKMSRKADGSPGGMMPCDPAILVGDGRRTLVVLDEDGYGHVVAKAPVGLVGREPHWASCPGRNRFKRGQQ